jgi:quinolinate synthase
METVIATETGIATRIDGRTTNERLDDIERKIDQCLEVHKYVMEQVGPMLEALSSSPMAKMFFG